MERECDGDIICFWFSHQSIDTATGRLGNMRMSGNHPNIITIGQNTESWRLDETYCHSDSLEKPSANAGVKKSQKSKIIKIIEIQMHQLTMARIPDLVLVNKKQRTCKIPNFAVPADHRVKLKESKNIERYYTVLGN